MMCVGCKLLGNINAQCITNRQQAMPNGGKKVISQSVFTKLSRLQDLVARQDELWERIQEAERAVRRVTMQHVQELRNRAERGVIAALAENEWTAFDNFCNQRMRDLNEARETCDAQLRVADILVDCVRGLVEGSIKGIAGVSANLIMDAQIKTLNTYSHVYHDQHLMLGEFIFRREQALTELKSKLEIAAINLELTGETLDPLAKKHADDFYNLTTASKKLEQEIISLKTRQHAADEQFSQVKEMLHALEGPQGHNPSKDTLEQLLLQKREKLAEYRNVLRPSSAPVQALRFARDIVVPSPITGPRTLRPLAS
eukprot:TRINITY_DN6398_c0_g1_i5.p3 TRINITY_DN6398_c0_g1~~TRINITY_DN6398_c0_g1_i5.p3  ORF type:complete len:314 (+),score=45.68 TRINITY_DN6398_c0_g1_i5:1857-2798(+)